MQKIIPNLWFNDNAEEAVNFYISTFKNSRLGRVARYDAAGAAASGRPAGSVMTMEFELDGLKFIALNGGPAFTLNPSVSFFLNFDPAKDKDARQHLDAMWKKLSDDGTALMPLDKYPFSEHYGWVQDKFGLSWQLILANPDGEERPFIVPSLLFVGDMCGKAEAASDFYLTLFENTKRGTIARYPQGMEPDQEGTIMYTDFMLEQQWFAAMDSAVEHKFNFNEAISFLVNCQNQQEVDYFWEKLTTAGGQESVCGWLKDKFGFSWQIVPTALPELLNDADHQRAQRVMQAMLQMKKIDINALKSA